MDTLNTVDTLNTMDTLNTGLIDSAKEKPVEEIVLSPSSLMKAQSEPVTFYLRKVRKDQLYPYETQNSAAAMGTAFDIAIKKKLIERGVKACKPVEYIESSLVKDKMTSPEDYDHIISEAEEWVKLYHQSGCIRETLWYDVERHSGGKIGEINVRGQLDASVIDSGIAVPFDFKVSGYTSKNGMTPKKGYYKIYKNGGWKPAHKIYREGIPIEEIDRKFGLQFCTYGLLMGLEAPFNVYFDHLCYNGKNKKKVIARYKARVTPAWADEVTEMYYDLINDLRTGKFHKEKLPPESKILVNGVGRDYLLRLLAENENWF